MNFFEKIRLENFRNFKEFTINFNNKCNVIIGPNGSGKTNILESISLFEKGRGFRKDHLKNMVNNNNQNNMFIINSNFIAKKNNLDLILSCTLNEDKFDVLNPFNGDIVESVANMSRSHIHEVLKKSLDFYCVSTSFFCCFNNLKSPI